MIVGQHDYGHLYNRIIMQQTDEILEKVKKLSSKEQLIFNIINQAPAIKKKIVTKTKLDTNQISRLLTGMSNMRIVKSIKLPQSKNLNVWVRYDFIEQDDGQLNLQMMEIVAQSQGQFDQIKSTLERKGYDTKGLKQIVRVLVNRGQIYYQNQRIWKRKLKEILNPCIGCDLFQLCIPTGPISPHNCPYYQKW